MVNAGVRIISFRTRNKDFASFFNMEKGCATAQTSLAYSPSLLSPHSPSDWCLFHRLFQEKSEGCAPAQWEEISQHFIVHSVIWQYLHWTSYLRKVMKDRDFEQFLTLKELNAWEAFKSIRHGFLDDTLGTRLSREYQEVVTVLWGYGMPNVIQDSLSLLPPQLLSSEPRCGDFHQDITKMESNYRGKWNPSMMGDFAGFSCLIS